MSLTSKKEIAKRIHWQAHQSTNTEMPENTMAAIHYAWGLGGIPEIDIRQTSDGIIVGIHDETPRRTTTVLGTDQDKLISEFTFDQTQSWDAGAKFSEKYRGEKVPALEQILTALLEYPEREVYLDFKQVDLEKLATLIQQYGVAQQIIFTHRDHENCKAIKRLVPSIRTMLWITGTVQEDTISKFEAAFNSGFEGLDIIQIHLVDADQREGWRYRVQREYLESAHQRLEQKGLELEVLPYQFEDSTLFELLDLGIRRFAVDEPKVFIEALQRYGES